MKPRVAILNNGEKKGGSRDAFANLRKVSGLEDVWQLHKSLAEGAQNYPDDRVANLDATTGHWLKVSARDDGSFGVTNGRASFTRLESSYRLASRVSASPKRSSVIPIRSRMPRYRLHILRFSSPASR